jgi:inorganic pyrophosphatase
MSRTDLTKLAAFDDETECWHAVIETPQGSHHKFDFDPELCCFILKKTLPQGMTFPLDFGFIPSTLADDGDPIDVLVVLDFPAQLGALVKVRLVGAIQAEQKEKGGNWERNDRLIAVAAHSDTLADIKSLNDLRPRQLDQLIQFFEQYNKLEGKQFRPVGNCDGKKAAALVRKGMKKQRKSK